MNLMHVIWTVRGILHAVGAALTFAVTNRPTH